MLDLQDLIWEYLKGHGWDELRLGPVGWRETEGIQIHLCDQPVSSRINGYINGAHSGHPWEPPRDSAGFCLYPRIEVEFRGAEITLWLARTSWIIEGALWMGAVDTHDPNSLSEMLELMGEWDTIEAEGEEGPYYLN
jgi:hypothetical protein